MRVIVAAEEHRDWKEVAKNNGINEKTARGIIQRGTSVNKRRGGRKHQKLLHEHEEHLLNKLTENPGPTLKSLKENSKNVFDLDVTISTIDRHLDSKLITLKKVHYQPEI